ncbi:restriction endonuclease subunit S [Mycoplasma suis]|uniref:restriction endonuclease subunit S n=1 Tax=Mycoplasma suis TaxID=57372 RepID=UPI001E4463DC|nr:restriction endonuclease subunit S [Mycoplasma suis]
MASPNGKYPFFTSSTKKIERINEYSFEGDAILITNTGSSAINLFRGKFEASNNCFVVFDKRIKKFSLLYLLQEAIKINLENFYKEDSGGIKHLKSKKLSELKIIIPDNKTLEKFNEICENIQLKIENLQKNIERLEIMKNDLHKMIFNQKISVI